MSSVTPGKLVTPDTSTFTNANNIATTTTGSNDKKYLDTNIKITKANADSSIATITNTKINGETVSLLDGEKIVGLDNLNFTPITTENTSLPGSIKLTEENLPGNVAYINQDDKLDSSVWVSTDQIVPKLIVPNEDEISNVEFPNQLSGNILVNVDQILGLNNPDQATIEANVKESIVNDTDFISDIADSVEAEIATGANIVTLNGEQTITGDKKFDGLLYTDALTSYGNNANRSTTTYLSITEAIDTSWNLYHRNINLNAGKNELSILPGNIDLKAPIKNSLNICDLDKYSEYPNITHVNGLYVYAIQQIANNTLHVYLTDNRQAFLDSLDMVQETSSSGETVYRGKFKEITDESSLTEEDLANIVSPFGGDYEAYTQVHSEADYTLYLSLFTWNDKINLCSTSYYNYHESIDDNTVEITPDYIVLQAGADTVTNILNEGLGTVSRNDPRLFSWFKGLLIPTGYTNSGSEGLIYNLWGNDPGVEFTINSVALGSDNFSSGINSIVAGTENKTFGRYNAAIGKSNSNYGYCSGIIGRNNSLNAQNSFIAGSYNSVDSSGGNGCFIIGGQNGSANTITNQNTVAIGFSNTINKDQAMAIGFNNTIPDSATLNSVVLGRLAKVNNSAVITLGCGSNSVTKNALWSDGNKVYFDDLPVNISTTVNISDLKLPKLFAGFTSANRTIGPLAYASFSFGHENDPANINQQMLLGSWLTGAQQYSTIVGTGNDPDPNNITVDRPVFIVGDGETGADSFKHNAIEVGRNASGININTKTNFNSDIYVKTLQGHRAKLEFNEVNGSIIINAVLVNQ